MTGQGDRGDEAYQVGVGVARRYLGLHPGLARWRDDLTSDSLLGATKALRDYDPQRGSFSAYVALRARGEIIDGIRRRSPVNNHAYQRGTRPEDMPPAALAPVALEVTVNGEILDRTLSSHEGGYEVVDARLFLAKLLPHLPAYRRYLVTEVFLRDREQADLAREMGVTEDAIYRTVRESLKRLRAVLDHYERWGGPPPPNAARPWRNQWKHHPAA